MKVQEVKCGSYPSSKGKFSRSGKKTLGIPWWTTSLLDQSGQNIFHAANFIWFCVIVLLLYCSQLKPWSSPFHFCTWDTPHFLFYSFIHSLPSIAICHYHDQALIAHHWFRPGHSSVFCFVPISKAKTSLSQVKMVVLPLEVVCEFVT